MARAPIAVLYLNNAPFVGGAQITLRAIIERLDRSRFEPYLALPDDRPDLARFFADVDVPIWLVPMYALNPPTARAFVGFVTAARKLAALMKRARVLIVHSNTQRGGPYGLALRLATGAKFVWTLNDVGLHWQVRIFTPFAHTLTCVSRTVYDTLRGWPRGHARVIYNGVVVQERPATERLAIRVSLRRGLGIPIDGVVVGNISRLEPWKGVHVVVESMRRLMRERPDVWFVQIGDIAPNQDDYAHAVRAACEALPDGRGRMLGFRSNVHDWYEAFDLFAHAPLLLRSGHTESFGMTVAEAMGYGLPVVASAVGGIAEVVRDGETGVLLPPERPDLFATAVARLAASPDLRRRLGEAGRARQRECFAQEREVRDFERLYEELVDGAGARVRDASAP